MWIFSFFLIIFSITYACDLDECFINENGKRKLEQNHDFYVKKQPALKYLIKEKLVEFSSCSKQISEIQGLKNLIKEPDFFDVAEKLLKDPDHDEEIQNFLLSIAQDPCIKRIFKENARRILDCDYTPIFSSKSHKQAGIEAQTAIDSLNRFEAWVNKQFSLLYYKKHEPEIFNAYSSIIKNSNVHMFYRIKSIKILMTSQNQLSEDMIEILLSILKDTPSSSTKTKLSMECFIETAKILINATKYKKKIIKDIFSWNIMKFMDQSGFFLEHLLNDKETISSIPYILSTIIKLLPPDSIESKFFANFLEKLFYFLVIQVKEEEKKNILTRYIFFIGNILGENHFITKKILHFSLNHIDVNEFPIFLKKHKNLLERQKERISHNLKNAICTNDQGIKTQVSLNFDQVMVCNDIFDLSLSKQNDVEGSVNQIELFNFDKKDLYPCVQKLFEEYSLLSQNHKISLDTQLNNFKLKELIDFGVPFLFSSIKEADQKYFQKKLSYILNQIKNHQHIPPSQDTGLTEGSYVLLKLLLNIKKSNRCKEIAINLIYPVLFNGIFCKNNEKISLSYNLKRSIFNFLQKDKEVALYLMTKKFSEFENSENFFEDIQYLHSILGIHIGLYPTSEKLEINYDETIINSKIYELTTQELLNMFYNNFFTPEKLLYHIKYLINYKTIKIFCGEQDVTLEIAYSELRRDSKDNTSMYFTRKNGFLNSITDLGVMNLLIRFGFLRSTPCF